MSDLVLDSWAILAWLKGQQPEAERVRLILESTASGQHRLLMNIVNLGEVFYLSVKGKNHAYGQRVLRNLRSFVVTVSATDELVLAAANLKAHYAISYADAFASATAIANAAPLVTGDRELQAMAQTEKRLKLHWIA